MQVLTGAITSGAIGYQFYTSAIVQKAEANDVNWVRAAGICCWQDGEKCQGQQTITAVMGDVVSVQLFTTCIHQSHRPRLVGASCSSDQSHTLCQAYAAKPPLGVMLLQGMVLATLAGAVISEFLQVDPCTSCMSMCAELPCTRQAAWRNKQTEIQPCNIASSTLQPHAQYGQHMAWRC
jgi:hypothetical protein